MKASVKQVFLSFPLLWLQPQRPKGVFLEVGTQNVRDIPQFLMKVGGIRCLVSCSGPNLVVYESLLLVV